MTTSLALTANDFAAPLPGESPHPLVLSWQCGNHDPVPGQGVAGVYVIWRIGRYGYECLAVGDGRDIAIDLARSIGERHVSGYAASGALEVCWAAVASLHRPGVADWLTATLRPTLPRSASVARPIPVNLPH